MEKEIKVFEAEVKEADENDLTVVHFISTERLDRGNDILYADGMKIEGKPVVLFQHGYANMGMEPIAKPLWIKKGEFKNRKGIQAKTQFYPDEIGQRLWRKTTEGYMPNWSIGWRPIRQEYKQDKNGNEIRHVYEWELLEYSLVAVPMQPDAQTIFEGEKDVSFPPIYVKMLSESEERRGELVGWRKEDNTWEMKPYPNEHACQLEDPDKYIRFRRENDKFGKGIHAIWGVQSGNDPVELQAIRFDKEKFSPAEARKWLKEHDYKCKLFEPASEKCKYCNEDMLYKWNIDNSEEIEYSCNCSNRKEDKDLKRKDLKRIEDHLKEVDSSLMEIRESISLIKQSIKDLSDHLTAFSVAVEKKTDESIQLKPTEEVKKVLVIDSETRKNLTIDLKDLINKTIHETVKSELDRLRGKVN